MVTTTYRYNEANQLCWRALSSPTNPCGSLPAGGTAFTYDADGEQLTNVGGTSSATYNRRMQTTALASTPFTYAGPGQAQRITIGTTQIVNNLLGMASQTTSGGTADYFTRDESGAFVSQRRPSAAAYTHSSTNSARPAP